LVQNLSAIHHENAMAGSPDQTEDQALATFVQENESEEDNDIVNMKAKFNQLLSNFGKDHVRDLQK
jgi:hypothetical protein